MTMIRIAIAVLGVAVIGGADLAFAGQKKATTPSACFIDDGYGRKRRCAQDYQQKRYEHVRDSCFTDDVYGRRRPCTAN